jgi:lipoprotein-anchoring transpeptidase ErfK/SrfK
VPDDRPFRPVRLNAAPRMKSPPRRNAPKRPRRPRRSGGNGHGMFWLAALIVVVLVGLIAVYFEVPGVKTWLMAEVSPEDAATKYPLESLPQHESAPSVPPKAPVVAPQPTAEEVKRKLREQADAATRKLEQATAAAQPTNAPVPVIAPAPGQPPVAPPAHVAPARALPVDANVLTTERIAAYQVALERVHFSCGFVDGDQGMRTQRMLRAYQKEHGLAVTGFLDPNTRAAIGEPGDPFLTYTVKEEDVASIMAKPPTWRDKAKATRLGYNDIWELLAEKFHCTRGYLHQLNPDVHTPVAGTQIVGPKVFPATPLPHAASLRIYLGETSLEALDARGHVIAFFPCSIAKDKNKRPHGELTVKVVDDHPDYTFDPALFVDASKAEGITHKLTIPPGPRNPVGTTWVGLSLPGYGIHGTPDPESISRTQSHGCFRLANWNAEKVLKMVSVGTPVDVEP